MFFRSGYLTDFSDSQPRGDAASATSPSRAHQNVDLLFADDLRQVERRSRREQRRPADAEEGAKTKDELDAELDALFKEIL